MVHILGLVSRVPLLPLLDSATCPHGAKAAPDHEEWTGVAVRLHSFPAEPGSARDVAPSPWLTDFWCTVQQKQQVSECNSVGELL